MAECQTRSEVNDFTVSLTVNTDPDTLGEPSAFGLHWAAVTRSAPFAVGIF